VPKPPTRSLARTRRRWLVVIALVLIVGVTCGVGVLVEAGNVARDDESLAPPGRIVAVGSGSWRIQCDGEGQPTVLLEAGLGESGMTWAGIQAPLSHEGRVCSYDRAGYGWSSPATVHDALAQSGQLHALLAAASVEGPYVLVAHSLGSFVSRLFAASYPDEVAGLVLIDPTNEVTLAAAGAPALQLVVSGAQALAARVGLLRPFAADLVKGDTGTPPADLLRLAPFLYRASAIDTSSQELASSPTSAEQVAEYPMRPSLPLVVILTSESVNDESHFATLGEHVSIIDAGDTGHYVHYARPQLVIDSIGELR
jgi:pimeloyl-ACP methyl ester carboxylesterase